MPKKQRKALKRKRALQRFRVAFAAYCNQYERQAEPPRAFRPRDY